MRSILTIISKLILSIGLILSLVIGSGLKDRQEKTLDKLRVKLETSETELQRVIRKSEYLKFIISLTDKPGMKVEYLKRRHLMLKSGEIIIIIPSN